MPVVALSPTRRCKPLQVRSRVSRPTTKTKRWSLQDTRQHLLTAAGGRTLAKAIVGSQRLEEEESGEGRVTIGQR